MSDVDELNEAVRLFRETGGQAALTEIVRLSGLFSPEVAAASIRGQTAEVIAKAIATAEALLVDVEAMAAATAKATEAREQMKRDREAHYEWSISLDKFRDGSEQ